jgi:hypothetical protein
MSFDLTNLIGKTITHVEEHDSGSGLGTSIITLSFSDGSEMDICGRGCDEGGWLEIDGTGM